MAETERHRLALVSNRGPIAYERIDGERVTRRGGGGLVTALRGLIRTHDVLWVANAMTDEDRRVARDQHGRPRREEDAHGDMFQLALALPDEDDYARAYSEIANPLLWFVQHGLHDGGLSPIIDRATRDGWAAYRRSNATIAATASAAAADREALMIHDYQLYLVPSLLRESGVRARILHFTHIPWPGPHAWRVLPFDIRTELIHGLLGADIVGFHTQGDVLNFLRTCEAMLAQDRIEIDYARGSVRFTRDRSSREVAVRAYPISVDPTEMRQHIDAPEVQAAHAELLRTRPERLILRVERTDPSKNTVRGLRALGRLLERRPDLHGRVGMLTLLDPSRQSIPAYQDYVDAIVQTAEEVNATHGRDGWLPIDLRIGDNFHTAIAAYRQYDVLYVNAVADGMNLVAKEGPLLNERDGVLVISESTGAYDELREHALAVDPFDIEQQAAHLERALDLPAADRARMAAGLRATVEERHVGRWIDAQLDDLDALAPA